MRAPTAATVRPSSFPASVPAFALSPPERCVRRRGRRVSSSGSTALCDNCCIAASRGFHPSRAGQGGSRGVHQVSEPSAIEQVTLNAGDKAVRSEEHTSELQSLMRISYAVFCLKKKKKQEMTNITQL